MLGGATTVGAVRPAAFRSCASRPNSLAAGIVVSSASIVAHISSRVRKLNEQPPRFALIVGSCARFLPVARPTFAECCEFCCGIEATLPCLASDDDDAVDA